MSKGQKRSNRETKKPKQTPVAKAKTSGFPLTTPAAGTSYKERFKKVTPNA